MFWDIEHTERILKWYRDFIVKAPEDLYGFFALLTVPGPPFPEELHGKKMCGIIWNYLGDPENFDEIFKPVLDLKPTFEHVGPMPFPVLNSMFDALYPTGLQWYWRADFINDIPDEAVIEYDERLTVSSSALDGGGLRFNLRIDDPVFIFKKWR